MSERPVRIKKDIYLLLTQLASRLDCPIETLANIGLKWFLEEYCKEPLFIEIMAELRAAPKRRGRKV